MNPAPSLYSSLLDFFFEYFQKCGIIVYLNAK
jgi:hypothetical protein